jgi:23S rRNA (cytidine1920-2'-O)/16S rRNA (cytidine1409-2'-O)-methyltransferase
MKPAAVRQAGGRERRQERGRTRLDVALVARGLVPSREQAARLILAGAVLVGGRPAGKPGSPVGSDVDIALRRAPAFVSRGGDKLAHALRALSVDPGNQVCLDVGASTGGFTHCLLRHGAVRVYAVDVGAGQLDAGLRSDPRVVVMERVNARTLAAGSLPERPRLATVDVSFISLTKILPALRQVLAPEGEVLALVKPQFEVGRGQVGKGGVVRDRAQHRAVLAQVARFAILAGWHVRGVTASPLKGPKGNREFFLHLALGGRSVGDLEVRIERALDEAPA